MIRPTPDEKRKLYAAINVLDNLGERDLAHRLCKVAALRVGEAPPPMERLCTCSEPDYQDEHCPLHGAVQEFEKLVTEWGEAVPQETPEPVSPFWAAAAEQMKREGY